eukprot:Sdes_comp11039_c0_seq1m2672
MVSLEPLSEVPEVDKRPNESPLSSINVIHWMSKKACFEEYTGFKLLCSSQFDYKNPRYFFLHYVNRKTKFECTKIVYGHSNLIHIMVNDIHPAKKDEHQQDKLENEAEPQSKNEKKINNT